MKIRLLTLIFFCFSVSSVYSQVLKGKISDPSGKAVEYATVYVKELRQGTISNSDGEYELSLNPGTYKITFQSLGYQPVTEQITLSSSSVTRNLVLQLQYYSIPEVRISAKGEDPAYRVMRKAIGMAPYYLNNISYYKAEVYLKGNLVINKIPRYLQKSMKIEASGNSTTVSAGGKQKQGSGDRYLKPGDTFLMESLNEIEFTAPDKYVQKVKSYNSTFPTQGNEISPMDFIQASFYQPVLAGMVISPLAPNAFSHYNFKYQGATSQGNITINKISVKPKRKSQQLFEGTIFIIEDLWCLQSVDLTNENLIGTIRIQQFYTPVENDIWLPVSHKFEVNIGIIGLKADAGYGSSVRYLEVRQNKSIKPVAEAGLKSADTASLSVPAKQSKSKSQQEIQKIIEKEKMTDRDMVKLSRLMEKEAKDALPDSIKNSLEIKDNTKQIIEKGAGKKDSSYWAKVRPIPLTDLEVKSIQLRDSIKSLQQITAQSADTAGVAKTGNTPAKGKKHPLRRIISGHTWSDTTGLRITYNGLLDLKRLYFNSVDGFGYSIGMNVSKSWKNRGSINISPSAGWAFSRQKPFWSLYSAYSFRDSHHWQLYLRGGHSAKDISGGIGINPLINSITSLLARKNYLKLYESESVRIGASSEITNGLQSEFSFGFENRKVLGNNTNFSLYKKDGSYSPNVPVNDYLAEGSNPINSLRNQKHFDLQYSLSYTPRQKYRLSGKVKVPAGSDWPTFELTWKHGFNEYSEMNTKWRQYDMLRFEVSKTRDAGAFSTLRWRLRAAGYLDNRTLTYYDFFHINSQPFPFMINNYEDAFMLPAFYSLSTPEFFVEGHVKYTSPYLLLKLLPGFSKTLMRENISYSFLGTRNHKTYSEIGYSVSEIFFLGELGVYAGFDNLTYRSIGVRAVLNFR